MIEAIHRVRRLSVKDEWPSCDFCAEPFCNGYTLYLDADQKDVVVNVCSKCLLKAATTKTGLLNQANKVD